MNLPNKLTLSRIIMTPVFVVWFFIVDYLNINPVLYGAVLLVICGSMELTDMLDGKIARKRNLVTDLGKVMDPFGDVIIHLTFFTCFFYIRIMPVWAFLVIFWREFAQSFFRMLMMGKGKPMSANIFGKAKTCLYAFSCACSFFCRIFMVAENEQVWLTHTCKVLFSMSAVAAALSFIIYVRAIIKQGTLSDMTR